MAPAGPPLLIAGRYRVVSQLGRGGMGEVFRALDEKLNREVALKRLPLSKAQDPQARRRLMREARAVAQIDHPGIVQIFDVGETDDGEVFLVMELVHGHTVRDLFHQGELDAAAVLRVVNDVADTLGAVHRAGIVHRDVKPENVMVRTDGRTVLLDFGVTKLLPEAPGGALVSTQLTGDGTVLGTPAYLSPEQASGEEVGPPSDQFSLAVMAYQLLCGRLPWTATHPFAMIGQILSFEPPRPSDVREGLSPAADAVLLRALAKVPSERYPSAATFAEALAGAVALPLGPAPLLLPPRETDDGSEAVRIAGSTHVIEPTVGSGDALGATLASREGEAPTLEPISPSPARRAPSAPEKVRTARDPQPAPAVADRRSRWGETPQAPRPSRRAPTLLRVAAAVGLVAATAAMVWIAQSWARRIEGPPPKPVPPLVAPSSVLACPILEASGVAEPAARPGAAAADCACQRAGALFGGRTERTLVPAQLLDLPREPVADFPDDPYVEAGARERSTRAAQTKADAYLDGSVTREARGYRVSFRLHRRDGELLATAEGEGPGLFGAVAQAIDRLAGGPSLPRATTVAPEVTRWQGIRGVDALLFLQLARGTNDEALCGEAPRHRQDLGAQWFQLPVDCPTASGDRREAPAIDRSSHEALAQTAYAYAVRNMQEAAAIVEELDQARQKEPSPIGRALLATDEGMLLNAVGDRARALAVMLEAVRTGLPQHAWSVLASVGNEARYARAAAAWEPMGLWFVPNTTLGPALTLRYARRRYELGDNSLREIALAAQALLAAGIRDEVLAMAEAQAVDTDAQRDTREYLYGLIARSQTKLDKALGAQRAIVLRAPKAGLNQPTLELLALADLLGRSSAIADAWIARFALGDDVESRRGPGYELMAPAICMRASREPGRRCFERMERLRRPDGGARSDSYDVLLRGAERYASGDVRSAVEEWRPLLKDNLKWYLRVIPIDAFDQAGESELAEKLDADLLQDKGWGGISPAYPRAARRAAQRGDRERARALAKQVVDAWIDADTHVPAVSEMQALQRQLR